MHDGLYNLMIQTPISAVMMTLSMTLSSEAYKAYRATISALLIRLSSKML